MKILLRTTNPEPYKYHLILTKKGQYFVAEFMFDFWAAFGGYPIDINSVLKVWKL